MSNDAIDQFGAVAEDAHSPVHAGVRSRSASTSASLARKFVRDLMAVLSHEHEAPGQGRTLALAVGR